MSDINHDGPERRFTDRRADTLTEDRVRLLIQTAVSQAMRDHEVQVLTHMDKQFSMLRQAFNDAFPGGDPHGHRIAHEKQIAHANWWDKAKGDAFSKVASAGIWAIVMFLAIAAWEHIKQEARK